MGSRVVASHTTGRMVRQIGVTRVLSKFVAVRPLLELDIGPGRLQARSAAQKRLLTRERNRLHDRHRAPLGAGGLEGSAT